MSSILKKFPWKFRNILCCFYKLFTATLWRCGHCDTWKIFTTKIDKIKYVWHERKFEYLKLEGYFEDVQSIFCHKNLILTKKFCPTCSVRWHYCKAKQRLGTWESISLFSSSCRSTKRNRVGTSCFFVPHPRKWVTIAASCYCNQRKCVIFQTFLCLLMNHLSIALGQKRTF